MKTLSNIGKQTLLVILDGFGMRENTFKNAIANAHKPTIDKLFKHYPNTLIEAGGTPVGLPKGVSGNSEVGHMNLGAGRSIRQDLVRINESIDKNTLAGLDNLKKLINHASSNSKRIHLMGLLSDGGVHSHIDHLKAINNILSKENELAVYFHAFMDGRDTPADSGLSYIEEILKWDKLVLASMQGRSISMDRDQRWEKTKLCYDTLIGKGNIQKIAPEKYLQSQYDEKIYDEFITPVLFDQDFSIQAGDAIFFINFRPDRAIQISQAFTLPQFDKFERSFICPFFLCMTPYIEEDISLPILFNKEKVPGGISEYLSSLNLKQFKIAETEKYAHITYFFNGGQKDPHPGETQILIPSPKEVATYDEKPEMSAFEVTERLLEALPNKSYSFFLVNFANSDMVGHTGNYEAALKAIEAIDKCLARLIDQCEKENITLILTADHGNSDQMVYENGNIHTSHTSSKVPFLVFHPALKDNKLELNNKGGDTFALRDVAPTVLHSLGIEVPQIYSGKNIFN